jgi:four helix bundle protein
MTTTFRFETLDVWKRASSLSLRLFEFADELEERRRYRFAEQFRAAVLSVTNNVAEGSGSASAREFANFVNIARRSVFEVANMLLLFRNAGLVEGERVDGWMSELDALSRMLERFRQSLARRAAASTPPPATPR